MTVDPKYSNLPWLAQDQKDVYETDDPLPESDQKDKKEADPASNVVGELEVDVEGTKAQLKSKQLRSTTDRVDFSDRISASIRTGYIAFDTDELVAGSTVDGLSEVESEPVLARFQRLQCEIAQLVSEVEAAKAEVAAVVKAPKAADGEAVTAASLVSEKAAAVCSTLSQAHLEQAVGEEQGHLASRSESLLGNSGRLAQQIEAYKSKKGAPTPAEDPKAAHIVCEMYHSGERIKNLESAKFAECEQRIQRLEAMLGPPPAQQRFSLDASPPGHRALRDVAARLHNSAGQLSEGSFLDQMESRLGAVHAKLGQVTQKKEAVATADTQNKVAELYEIVKKWECMAPVVPEIVDRLVAVKELHEQAMQFTQSTGFVSDSQKEVEGALKTHKALISKLESSLEGSLAKASAAGESIGKRVQGLK